MSLITDIKKFNVTWAMGRDVVIKMSKSVKYYLNGTKAKYIIF